MKLMRISTKVLFGGDLTFLIGHSVTFSNDGQSAPCQYMFCFHFLMVSPFSAQLLIEQECATPLVFLSDPQSVFEAMLLPQSLICR